MCVVSKEHTIKVTLFTGYNFRGFWFTCVFADIVFSVFYYAIKIGFVLTHVDMLHHIPKRCRHVTRKFSPVHSCGSISLMHLLLGFYGYQLKRAKELWFAAKTHVATIKDTSIAELVSKGRNQFAPISIYKMIQLRNCLYFLWF